MAQQYPDLVTKALVIVDMQNDFIFGEDFTSDESVGIINNVLNYIKLFRLTTSKRKIFLTRDTHFSNLWKNNIESYLPIHCDIGTDGWQIIEPIESLIKNIIEKEDAKEEFQIVDKYTYGSTDLANHISEFFEQFLLDCRSVGIVSSSIKEGIDIIGVCTDICVISNALLLKAAIPSVNIKVISCCCAGTTPENHQKAIDIMRLNGIEVIEKPIEELCEYYNISCEEKYNKEELVCDLSDEEF